LDKTDNISNKKSGLQAEEVINSIIIHDIDTLLQTCTEVRHKDLLNEIKKVLRSRKGFKISISPKRSFTLEMISDIDKNFRTPFELADYLDVKLTAF
jgi:hypothetical protein